MPRKPPSPIVPTRSADKRPNTLLRSHAFQREWERLQLTDDDLIALEQQLNQDPASAPLVPGTGGLRKARFAPPSFRRGKSGSTRVGYCYFEIYGTIHLLAIYAKSDQSDLSPSERSRIRDLIGLLARSHAPKARKE